MPESKEQVYVEPMRAEDVEAVIRIERMSFPVPWMQTAFTTELSNRSAYYLVARCNETVVGFGGAWVIMDEAHITTLAVDPQQRGRHIGERLLIALLETGILRGASRATLEVRQNNRVARNLYEKFGFYEASIRKNYYTDNGENAIVMWVDNIHTPSYQTVLLALYDSIVGPIG